MNLDMYVDRVTARSPHVGGVPGYNLIHLHIIERRGGVM
jgi:hypothetical protein